MARRALLAALLLPLQRTPRPCEVQIRIDRGPTVHVRCTNMDKAQIVDLLSEGLLGTEKHKLAAVLLDQAKDVSLTLTSERESCS